MSTERLPYPGDEPDYDRDYRPLRDAIVAILGPQLSKEEVRALRACADRTLTTVEAHAYPVVRALRPSEPGYDLAADDIVAQQENTADFLAFLDSRPAADGHDANSRWDGSVKRY